MAKRTKIVNDPADIVPLLRTFGSKQHKKVFDELSVEWRTREELDDILGYDSSESVELFKEGGLLETKWRMPQPGETPDKEYHASYSKIMTNFQCTFQDFSDLIMISFMEDDQLMEIASVIAKEVTEGKVVSVSNLCRTLDISPAFLRGIANRSNIVEVKGQRIELNKENLSD